jgi:hypothetical protein
MISLVQIDHRNNVQRKKLCRKQCKNEIIEQETSNREIRLVSSFQQHGRAHTRTQQVEKIRKTGCWVHTISIRG